MPKIIDSPPAPGSAEWSRMITASKVPGILGVSRWTSQFAAWHELAGNVDHPPMNEDRAAWGHIAEESLAKWWLHNNPGWHLNVARRGRAEIAYTNDELPFPNMATIDRRALNRKFGSTNPERFFIIECKTAMSMNDWGRPGEPDSIPYDYLTQVNFQQGVSGIHKAAIVVLGPTGVPEIHNVAWDPELFDIVVGKLAEAYEAIRAGDFPPLDESKATYDAVRGMHPEIDRDGRVEVDRETAVRWLDTAEAEKEAKSAVIGVKSEAAQLMGSARIAEYRGVKIADRRSRMGATPQVYFNRSADLGEEA